jgi:hypothetical protein
VWLLPSDPSLPLHFAPSSLPSSSLSPEGVGVGVGPLLPPSASLLLLSSSAAAAAAASAASADDNDNEPKKPKKTKEELLALQTTQQTELTRRYEGEHDLTYAERNDQRALEIRQQKLLTREETSALLTKLRAEAQCARSPSDDLHER